jgi:hypothetical protein
MGAGGRSIVPAFGPPGFLWSCNKADAGLLAAAGGEKRGRNAAADVGWGCRREPYEPCRRRERGRPKRLTANLPTESADDVVVPAD